MIHLHALPSDAGWGILVRTMLHTLWEGAALAILLWTVLRVTSARPAAFRYLASCGAMAGILLTAMLTWAVLGRANTPMEMKATPSAGVWQTNVEPSATPAISPRSLAVQFPQIRRRAPIPWTTWAGWGWAAGAAGLLLRTWVRISAAQRWSAGGTPLTDEHWAGHINQLARRLGIRRAVRVRVGDAWRVPAVMGFVWPTLLLPASLLNEVPAWQLQMILAHELAHVRRWDYAVNFVQQVIEAVLFFNPAVWWVSRQIRVEREACCDAWAVRINQSPTQAAQTLASFAERMGRFGPAAALAFDGHGQLLDRVARILRPERTPAVRAPWYVPLVAISAAMLLLGALHRGAEVAVAAAEQLLTPQQRVDQIDAAQRQQAAAESAAEHPAQCTVRGIVRTADGSPLPASFKSLLILSNAAQRQTGSSARIERDGHFQQQVEGGEIRLFAEVDGYAPIFTDRLHPDAKGQVGPVELVLTGGFDAQIRVADASGTSIPGVKISGVYQEGFVLGRQTTTTDAAGQAVLHHITDAMPIHLTAEIPGYQFEALDVKLAEGRPLIWPLTRAEPTSGTVVDAGTGEVIAGASIRLVQRKGYEDVVHQPQKVWNSPPPVLATTDAAGRFSLDTLNRNARYVFWVTAPGHGSELFFGVHAGQKDLHWKLGHERIIRGRVTGDLKRLARQREGNRDVPCVSFNDDLHLEDTTYGATTEVPVAIQGDQATFEIRDPLPGPMTVCAGGQSKTVDVSNIPRLFEFTLAATEPAKRTVVFKFSLLAGAPTPKGKLKVFHSDPPFASYQPTSVAIENGQVRYEALAGEKVGYEPGDELAGYWFPERMDIEVPPGNKELEVTISGLQPAGAVYGTVEDANRNPTRAGTFAVSVVGVDPGLPNPEGWMAPQPFNSQDADGSYILTPLLLGRSYRLIADGRDGRLVISDEFKLDATAPLRQITLRFDPGVSKQVRVLDPAARPRAGIPVRLEFDAPFSWSTQMAARQTDANGQVVFDKLNLNAGGQYSVVIEPGADYQGVNQPITVGRGQILEIKLEPGLPLTGRVLDETTGKPLARRKVEAWPANPDAGFRRTRAAAWTDADGRFAFANLDARTYSIHVEGTLPAGVIIEKNAAGQTTYRWPDGAPYPTARGGQKGDLEVRVHPMQ